MSRYVGGLVIDGIAYEIHGEYNMYAEVNELGQKVREGYDYYDVYTMGMELGCLTCVNEGHRFTEIPTADDIKKLLVESN